MTEARHPSFKFINKRPGSVSDAYGQPSPVIECEYEAAFWDGPIEAGQVGRYQTHRCRDVYFPKRDRFLNTAPSVSYYAHLKRAVL